jgi:dihydroxyacetone kinase
VTRLWNDPADFVDEMIDGFVAANGRHVRRVTGGVVRSTVTPDGEVAVVIGGGSGHYPAFGGLVGPGLAHGAVMGNLFSSPSTQQAHAVASTAQRGGGVLFSYGNYAGDVLNFDAAQERLRAEGIPCETVVVTDDIYSAPATEPERRRGIAGDLVVFRIASAAAAAGYDLAGVARVARHANDRTRSIGVAFDGCTLPGAPAPLFTVPTGRMAIGLGIHGEPGIDEVDVPTADELADLLVGRLLDEAPVPAGRVVPILNGLGSVKNEEMFVVYRRIAELLATAGLEVIDPHVGEYCTSFDMAGTSLTLFWLDDELEPLWATPVDTPAYRRGSVAAAVAVDIADSPGTPAGPVEFPPSDEASRAAASTVVDALGATARVIDAHADELGGMDAVAADGDHGLGMQRGAHAALAAATAARDAGAGAGATLAAAADAWSDRAGGTSGVLWGLILSALAERLGDQGVPTRSVIADGVAAGLESVTRHGKARVGDKTLVDALDPFSAELGRRAASGADLAVAWRSAAEAASRAAAETADLLPLLGRARANGEKSIGTPDPGAHSLALIVMAVGDILAASDGRGADA